MFERWLCNNNNAVREPVSFLITLSYRPSFFFCSLAAINYSANAPTAAAIAESFKDLN